MSNRPYVRPMGTTWWVSKAHYIRYMIRELTCLFVGLQALVLLIGLYRLSQGREAFDEFLATLWGPAGQMMSALILLMLVIHSASWFNLTPKAMPLWIGDKKVPGWMITGAHYGGWAVVSAVIVCLVGGRW